MQVFSLQQKYSRPIVLCLGFFDSMHTGHTELLKRAQKMAAGREVALFTFENNHFETLNRPTKLIYTFDERLKIYQSLGVDVVVSACFDRAFMATSGKNFLDNLVGSFCLGGIVCGEDFTCGGDLLSAEGVKEYLKDVCPVEIVPLVRQGEQKICSTYIRNLLLQNKVDEANCLLSEPFFFSGKVVHGRHVGEGMGFPTLNLQIPKDKLVPVGVYAGKVCVDNICYKAIVNVGSTPTFGLSDSKVEAHILDFCGDLYGKEVKIALLRYLRPIKKFENAQQLGEQLTRDVKAVKND